LASKIEFAEEAEKDLLAIRDYIAQDNPAAAERTLIRVQQSISYLKIFPGLGRPWRKTGARLLTIPRLPYRVLYEINGDTVRILAIVHARRDWP
jgi:addiction module RelE/StbE family toxin